MTMTDELMYICLEKRLYIFPRPKILHQNRPFCIYQNQKMVVNITEIKTRSKQAELNTV